MMVIVLVVMAIVLVGGWWWCAGGSGDELLDLYLEVGPSTFEHNNQEEILLPKLLLACFIPVAISEVLGSQATFTESPTSTPASGLSDQKSHN